jgi:3-hydroxyisobutyrate dehydrogenase-like beta-hydroxyacid dehydrogenase
MMTSSGTSAKVAFIGTGNMGAALAEALTTARYNVTVWNRTKSKCQPLGERGACIAKSAVEAASEAGVVIVCMTDDTASNAVLRDPDMTAALSGKLLVQLSTVTAEESQDLGLWAKANGIDYLDGSILGYPDGVRNGTVTIVYSGPEEMFDKHEDMLAAMAGKACFVSESIGGAPTFDKTVYAYHYGSMLAFFHGAAICHAAGFPIDVYVDQVAGSGEATSRRYGEQMASHSYDEPACTIDVHRAAYAHVVDLTEQLGIDLALAQLVASTLERATAEGHGQQELAALFEMMLSGAHEGAAEAKRA